MSRRTTATEASFAGYHPRGGVRDAFPRLPRNGIHAMGATYGDMEEAARTMRREKKRRRAVRISRVLHWTAIAARLVFWTPVVLVSVWLLSSMALVACP